MENTKSDVGLQASYYASEEELRISKELSSGITKDYTLWEIIIQYNGDLSDISSFHPSITVTPLSFPYAIVRIKKDLLADFLSLPQIIYAEQPKSIFFEQEATRAKQASCIFPSTQARFTGKGVLLAIIDSGIDIFHPDFIDPVTGETRILYLYDETLNQVFDSAMLNEALLLGRQAGGLRIQSSDLSGHGTHVAGIAGGNHGIAREASLVIVKLAPAVSTGFPNTAQLMEGIQFCVNTALELRMPMAVNISFGNTYGSHSGTSLLENYMDYVNELGKFAFVIGTGNEGSASGHATGKESADLEFTIGPYETSLSLQIWKYAWENISIEFQAPASSAIKVSNEPGSYRYQLDEDTYIYVLVGDATPYSPFQEIYINFFPMEGSFYLTSGIYTLRIRTSSPLYEGWHVWMPTAGVRNEQTRFLTPNVEYTLTIPSTSQRAISVGAYDSDLGIIAPFSGRGYTFGTNYIKPDLVAPGVNILSASAGGGYEIRSGTSMATPFVTGACCLYMQEGIVEGADPFLYGEKLKVRLIQDARPLPGQPAVPAPTYGWGRLCFRQKKSR